MGAFDPTRNACSGAGLKVEKGSITVHKRRCIALARILPGLKTAEPVDNDCQQGLLRYAVDARLFDGAVLEQNSQQPVTLNNSLRWIARSVKSTNDIPMICAASARRVSDFDLKLNSLIATDNVIG